MTAARRPEPAGDTPSYEAARDELLDVVRQLEAGGLPLETSLTLWERGEQLAVQCQSWLDGAKQRLAAKRPDATATDATATDATATGGTAIDDEEIEEEVE
jgi:exodeoxyribonuclease VII small subunit